MLKHFVCASLTFCTLVTPSLLYAAYSPEHESSQIIIKDGGKYQLNSDFGRRSDLMEWRVEDVELPNIWDGWRYGLDAPNYLTAEAGNSYYGFGVWKPEELQEYSLGSDGVTTQDWLMDHGLNFSFGTDSVDGGARYRFDVRWHEQTDTEIMLQLQVPFQ
ncbi:hypothetical protein [Enterovibrio norvegicus]|uniref:Uncharacterized protein n=1 Tax=Enterovibrio norvegicus TaxID=188144 RepID=A0A2N7LH18_9GAMM|nr:hypothetical protein [Enterovibrio norvegicus]PMN94851.1 hypothetical protein BCT23_02120 [Enterovibrio norvegicus]